MAEPIKNIQQKIDNFLTNYLRNTTTDQEILDFYGEGNVIGRKGIPTTEKELLDAVYASDRNRLENLRPSTNRPNYPVGGFGQEIDYDYETTDMPNVINPDTGQPWQMMFGALPKDFGSGSLTPSANQFLIDFRIPRNAGSDFSFATGPHIQDRINYEIKREVEDPRYKRYPDKLEEKLKEIRNQSAYIGTFSGSPRTPRTWQELGYISRKPENLKEEVINEFRKKILQTQGPFGGVSTLTPVRESLARNPNWRADLYQTEGLAGPISNQYYGTGYGTESTDVQRFTTGAKRLLPLQPYSEFLPSNSDHVTLKSVFGTTPAEDFTPFQKAIGTRNYLIGRNILKGRGSLGLPVRTASDIGRPIKKTPASLLPGISDLIPSPEAIQTGYKRGPIEMGKQMGREFIESLPIGTALAAALSTPLLARAAPGVGLAFIGTAVAEAANEVVRQETGEGILPKLRQFLGTKKRSGIADRELPKPNQPLIPVIPEISAPSAQSKMEMIRRQNRNELQRRADLIKERFNPRKGEFGLSELLFGR
jgi:hypothetical protein